MPENEKSYPEFSMFGELPPWGFYVRHARGLTFKNIKLTLDKHDFRPAFVFDEVDSLKMEQIKLPDQGKEQIILYNTNYVRLDDKSKSVAKIL